MTVVKAFQTLLLCQATEDAKRSPSFQVSWSSTQKHDSRTRSFAVTDGRSISELPATPDWAKKAVWPLGFKNYDHSKDVPAGLTDLRVVSNPTQ